MADKKVMDRFGVDREEFLSLFKKPKKYEPEEIGQKFLDYLEYMESKTWSKKEVLKGGQRAGEIIDVPISAPLSIQSFCVYASITHQTFLNYESVESYEKYFEVMAHIRKIIETNQIEGATVGAYNHNIIARLLGLSENVDHTTKGKEIDNHVSFEIVKGKSGKG